MTLPRSKSYTDLRENFPQLYAEDNSIEEQLALITVRPK